MKLTLRDVLNTVFRYSYALVIFWMVVVIAALVFYSQTNKLFDSKAKILISLGSEALGKANYLNGANSLLQQRDQQIHNEQQILESHEVMLTTAKWILGDPTPGSSAPAKDSRIDEARRFLMGQDAPPTPLLGLAKGFAQAMQHWFGRPPTHREQLEAISQQLSANLTVKTVFDSDALDVAFRFRDSDVAQTVLRLIIEAYLQHHIAVFQNTAEADLLKAQLAGSVDKYHERLGQFAAFMAAHRVYNDDSQLNVLIEQREKAKQSLNETLADDDAASARLGSLAAIQKSVHDFDRYSTTEIRNKERDALLAKLDDAAVEEQAVLSRHPKGSRAYEEEHSKLEKLRHLLEQEPERVVQETEQRKSKAAEFVEAEVINVTETQRGAKARAERLRGALQNINSEIDSYASDLKGFNALKLDLAFAKRESEQMAQVYEGSRLKTLTSQNAITDISVIDIPTWSSIPASPSKKVTLAATLLLLVMGSFAILFVCLGFDTTLADAATTELQLGVPVVGTLPLARGYSNDKRFAEVFTQNNHREFAKIHHSVRDPGPDGKIILIAESAAQEGASLVGYGLSRFLSQWSPRQKTAFVDRTESPVTDFASIADKAQNQHAILASHGREHSATSSVERNAPPPSGEVAMIVWPNEEQIAGDEAVGDVVSLLLKLRKEFAYVVVSAGAVKDSTDLMLMSGIVSAVFFVVEAGKTRRPAARYSLDLLTRYEFQNIRLILNKRIFYIPDWLMRFV